MRKVLIGLLAVVCIFGVGIIIYGNNKSCSVGKTYGYSFELDKVKTICSKFDLGSSFCNYSPEKVTEILKDGKAKVVFGEVFADIEYQGTIKSIPYKSCAFGVFSKKTDEEIKKVGYCFDFCLPALKVRYPKAEFEKYDSSENLITDIKSGKLDSVCLSDVVIPNEKDFKFELLNIKKQLVFVFKNDAKIDIKAFNEELLKVFSNQPAQNEEQSKEQAAPKTTTKTTPKPMPKAQIAKKKKMS